LNAAMKKHYLEREIEKQLAALNKTIDYKILKGRSYAREAVEHKYLLARLIQVKKYRRASFLSRFSLV
jgi:hypothetical protein